MAWIRVIPREEAEGPLREEYEAAEARAGRVWNIVSVMSQNPRVMKASMGIYLAIMYGPSPLSRVFSGAELPVRLRTLPSWSASSR